MRPMWFVFSIPMFYTGDNDDDDDNDNDNNNNNNIVLAFSLQLLFYSELLLFRPNVYPVTQLTVCILFGKISAHLHTLIIHAPLSC